jgi:hypothetical protein
MVSTYLVYLPPHSREHQHNYVPMDKVQAAVLDADVIMALDAAVQYSTTVCSNAGRGHA